MSIHVMLVITIPKFLCSIGPGVNEYAAGESFVLSFLFSISFALFHVLSSFCFAFFSTSFSSRFTIHGDSFKSMLLKRNRLKRKRCVDADCFHVFCLLWDWQEKETFLVLTFHVITVCWSLCFDYIEMVFVSYYDQSQTTWNLTMSCCELWLPMCYFRTHTCLIGWSVNYLLSTLWIIPTSLKKWNDSGMDMRKTNGFECRINNKFNMNIFLFEVERREKISYWFRLLHARAVCKRSCFTGQRQHCIKLE